MAAVNFLVLQKKWTCGCGCFPSCRHQLVEGCSSFKVGFRLRSKAILTFLTLDKTGSCSCRQSKPGSLFFPNLRPASWFARHPKPESWFSRCRCENPAFQLLLGPEQKKASAAQSNCQKLTFLLLAWFWLAGTESYSPMLADGIYILGQYSTSAKLWIEQIVLQDIQSQQKTKQTSSTLGTHSEAFNRAFKSPMANLLTVKGFIATIPLEPHPNKSILNRKLNVTTHTKHLRF